MYGRSRAICLSLLLSVLALAAADDTLTVLVPSVAPTVTAPSAAPAVGAPTAAEAPRLDVWTFDASSADGHEGPGGDVWTFDASSADGSEGPGGEVWTFDARADGGEAISEGLAAAEDDMSVAQNADGWWSSLAAGDGTQMSEGEMDDAVEGWWGRSSRAAAAADSDAASWWGNKQASGDAAKFMDGELDAEESEALQAVLSENEEMDGALRHRISGV